MSVPLPANAHPVLARMRVSMCVRVCVCVCVSVCMCVSACLLTLGATFTRCCPWLSCNRCPPFGVADSPFSSDAATFGTDVASFAVLNTFDGVDFDMENLAAGCIGGTMTGPDTVNWLMVATLAARRVLGSDRLLSHAPQAPYFGRVGDETSWAGATGCYTGVYQRTSSAIDWLNVQVARGRGGLDVH